MSSHKIYFRAPIIINQEHSLASGHISNSLSLVSLLSKTTKKWHPAIFITKANKKGETSTHTAKSPIIPTKEIEQLDRSKLANIFDTRLDWEEKTHFAPIGIENWALEIQVRKVENFHINFTKTVKAETYFWLPPKYWRPAFICLWVEMCAITARWNSPCWLLATWKQHKKIIKGIRKTKFPPEKNLSHY